MSDALRLETDRLILAPMQVADFADLCALYGDPGFAIPLFPQALTPEEVWTRLLRDVGHWRVVGYGHWAVRAKADNALVGGVGVLDYRREIEPPLSAPELGWGVAVRFQGQGLAREACKAVLGWCDTVLRAPVTTCIISPSNAASIRLAQRLGYVHRDDRRYKDADIGVYERDVVAAA